MGGVQDEGPPQEVAPAIMGVYVPGHLLFASEQLKQEADPAEE